MGNNPVFLSDKFTKQIDWNAVTGKPDYLGEAMAGTNIDFWNISVQLEEA